MKEKQSFLFYKDWADVIKDFPDDVQLELLQAIIQYAFYGIETDLQQSTKIAFRFIKPQIDRDTAKYIETVRKNTENGKKGGAPIGNNNAVKQPKKTETTQRLIKQPKQADNDNDIDNDKDNESEIDIKELSPDSLNKDLNDVFRIISNDNEWKKDIINYHKLKGEIPFKSYLKIFYDKLKSEGVNFKSVTDTKKHFSSWLKIELAKTRT